MKDYSKLYSTAASKLTKPAGRDPFVGLPRWTPPADNRPDTSKPVHRNTDTALIGGGWIDGVSGVEYTPFMLRQMEVDHAFGRKQRTIAELRALEITADKRHR